MIYSDFNNFLHETGLRGAMEHAQKARNSVLFVDFCRVADKYDFLRELADALAPTAHLHVLDGRATPPEAKQRSLASFIPAPPNAYYRPNAQVGPLDRQQTNSSFPELDEYANCFKQLTANYFDYVDENIITECVDTAFFYALVTMKLVQPKLVIVWNAFHPLSKATVAAAKQLSIPVAFAEFGLLPGTINVDFKGQMGASAVTKDAEAFNRLSTSKAALSQAQDMLDFLKETGLNRREQPIPSNVPDRIEKAAKGRPRVFFAGHNDFSSGTLPYNAEAQRDHSPFFEKSNEAARHLLDLAKKNDWLLVSKPHPFNIKSSDLKDGPNCLTLGDENINACIDACDVTVTVLSQTNYISLIREKPVVMIGQNQLNCSGAAYVAPSKESIVPMILQALEWGVSNEMKSAWLSHVSRLSSHYLYRYSQSVPDQITARPIAALGTEIAQILESGVVRDPFLNPQKNTQKEGSYAC